MGKQPWPVKLKPLHPQLCIGRRTTKPLTTMARFKFPILRWLMMTVTKLKVQVNTKDEFGRYTCAATNRHGRDSQDMELYESKLPIMTPVDLSTGLNLLPLPLNIALLCLLPVILNA